MPHAADDKGVDGERQPWIPVHEKAPPPQISFHPAIGQALRWDRRLKITLDPALKEVILQQQLIESLPIEFP